MKSKDDLVIKEMEHKLFSTNKTEIDEHEKHLYYW